MGSCPGWRCLRGAERAHRGGAFLLPPVTFLVDSPGTRKLSNPGDALSLRCKPRIDGDGDAGVGVAGHQEKPAAGGVNHDARVE